MNQVLKYRIEREPDLALSVRGSTNGWNLLPSKMNASMVTSSPAGHLLTTAQVQAIPPLATQKGSAPQSGGLFDPLYNSLVKLFAAQDFSAMDKAAAGFLKQHPISSFQSLSAADQRIRRFFQYKGKASTNAERIALIESLTEQEQAVWSRSAHSRIELEKAQTLATAVSGIKPPRGVDLIGGLRADLVFATLQVCYAAMPKRDKPCKLPNSFVDHVLELKPFLPPFVFELEICKTRSEQDDNTRGLLGRRLERLKSYDSNMRTAVGHVKAGQGKDSAANSVVAGEGKDGAAGTFGHTSNCDCKCSDAACVPIDPCCGEVRWYITDLLTLKDRTWCYKPSDIAYIENVAPYETRIRTHGHTRTVVETSEDETNSSREESLDHQVSDRFSLQTELTNNLKASLDVDAKLHYGKKDGPYSFDLNTKGALSKEIAYREAREQVREQVEHATLKMQVQTRKLRTRTVTTEQTETNKHKFKNTTAIAAVSKYFWVTQEKRGQLFSHGPRLHIDLLVPSPAMLFLKMEEIKRKAGEPQGPGDPPIAPGTEVSDRSGSTFVPLTPKDIKRETYVSLAAKYGVAGYDEPPPKVADGVAQTLGIQGTHKDGSINVTIPAGYTATKMDLTSEDVKWRVAGNWISLKFGGQEVKYIVGTGSSPGSVGMTERNSGSATISKGSVTLGKSSIGVVLTLTPDPPVQPDLTPWQNSVYALIMKKYQADLEKWEGKQADYEAALKAYNAAQDDKIKGRHPFACEEIMRTEMKRSSIFMMCGEMNWPDVMNMDSEMCHFPWPNRTKSDVATNEWYFFDRAFDWNLASFTFYDYFRNPLCKWVDTYEPNEPNFLFKAFLRAGYCRVMIPVAPGMEEDVQDYLQSGGLWGSTGTWPHNPSDPRWISVVDEIKHARGCYQQDREGYIEAYPDLVTGLFDSQIKVFTDRYWDIGSGGGIDQDEINLELDHQIYIDGNEYRITSLVANPNSLAFNALIPNQMSWLMGLDRKIEFAPWIDPAATTPLLKPYNWAVGAKYVGAPFHFDLPTDLIWIGDQANACLPCYPIDCVCEKAPEQLAKADGDCDDDSDCKDKPHAEDE
jgi:hypothetical protein